MRNFLVCLCFLFMMPAWCIAQDGYLDQATCTTISGWAYIPGANPPNPVTVAFYSNGVQFATTLANLYRPDVQAAIGGNGLNGFNFATPASLQNGVIHTVTAQVVGGTQLTADGPVTFNCTPQTPYYTYTEIAATNPGPSDPGNWTANGSIGSGYPGGSYTWNQTPSGWSSQYEVLTNISLTTGGGIYQHYIRAQSNALSGAGGNTFLVELQNPAFTSSGGCSANLAMYEIVNGAVTQPLAATVSCSQNTLMRTVVYGNTVATLVNGQYYSATTTISAGAPGYGAWGVPGGNSIVGVEIGPRNPAAPAPIVSQSVANSPFSDHIDMRWIEPVDTTGVGITQYQVLRSPNLANTFTVVGTLASQASTFTDETVTSSSTYQYLIAQTSFHGVTGGYLEFSATSSDQGNVDPMRRGIRPTGSYWGDKGEQIDMLSGNLNYTLPLFKVKNRIGGGATFSLNYNSQMWRQDAAGTWLLGEDVGYGLGWKLLAGSLTPYWNGTWGAVDHYLFTDSTGAQYKLYQVGSTGTWTSSESIYVTYDANTNLLHFTDGSFWVMGCTSGGTEADLGTLYPTQIEDSNGNYITIGYQSGAGTSWPNSSARISQIYDIRSPGSPTYSFIYDAVTNELTQINSIFLGPLGNPAPAFTFTTTNRSVASPTSSQAYFGVANVLTGVTAAPGYTTSFSYDTGAELTEVGFPTGGHYRYDYISWNYVGSAVGLTRQIREVSNRYLSANSDGSGEIVYPIGRSSDPNDGSLGVHQWGTLADPSGTGFKVWFFYSTSSTPVWQLGLVGNYMDRVSTSNAFAPRQYYFTWTQDAAGNAYISNKQTLWDGGTTYQVSSYDQQTLDTNGNILTRNVLDYTNSATPIRKYTYTYLTDSNYTSRYILNRLVSATVTDGSGNNAVTLVSNQYDGNGVLPFGCGLNASSPNYSSNPPSMHDNANYSDSFGYRGNLTVQTTPSGHTCTLYDMLGNPWFTKSPHTPGTAVATSNAASGGSNFSMPSAITTNGDSASTVTLNYNALFLPSSFTGPNGAVANAMYDNFGRITQSQSTDGAYTSYTYSTGAPPMTQLAWTFLPGPKNSTWTQTTLDGLGRAIKVQSGPGNTPGNAVTETDTVYGPCACSPTGKMTQVSQPFLPGASQYWTTYTYDAIGRTVSVVSPDGASTTATTYRGNTTTVQDPAGKTKTTTSDVQGNITIVAEPDPANSTATNCAGATETGTLFTCYTYDVMEHLTQVSMPRSNWTQTRTFTYSPTTHLLTSETHPETGTTTYTYTPDSFTNDVLTSRTDAKGQVTKYTYDSYYRVTAINRYTSVANFNSNNDDPCQRVNYVYDSYSGSGFTSQNAWGHVAAVSSGDPGCTVVPASAGNGTTVQQQFTELYSYSSPGHVTQKRLQQLLQFAGDPNQQQTSSWDVLYSYNQFGQATSVTYPQTSYSYAPATFTTGFDTMQRPNTLTMSVSSVPNTTVVSGVTYNAANQPTQTSFGFPYPGTSFTENRSYNAMGQLITLNNASVNVSYNYSNTANNGQITSMTDSMVGQTVSYTYDALKRLTGAAATGTSVWSQQYTYDGFGNMTQKSGSGATFNNYVDPATNRLAFGNFCYDPNGNPVSDQNGGGCGNPNYMYDIANRMVSAKVSGGTETYQYGADNKRLSKIVLSTTYTQTIYIYGAMGEKLTVIGGGNLPANNVYWAGRLIAQGSAFTPGNNYLTFAGADRLGSVSSDGTAGRTFYLPYGEELSATANDRIKFATYTRDGSTGLDYADQRFFTSQFGRFMSADRFKRAAKVNSSGSWNKYSYVQNDPVNQTDRHGTCEDSEECEEPDLSLCDINPLDPMCTGDSEGDPGAPDAAGPVTSKYQAKDAAQKALKSLNPNCFKALGVSQQTLSAKENTVNYIDGRTSEDGNLNINSTFGPVFSVGPGATFNSVVYGSYAVTLNYLNGGNSNNVVLGANFFGEDATAQGFTLIHELLHVQFSTLNDPQFAAKFAHYTGDPKDINAASKTITDWLKGGCK
jgi:RHS repeat-associated protein